MISQKSLDVVEEEIENIMPEAQIQLIAADNDALIPYHARQEALHTLVQKHLLILLR